MEWRSCTRRAFTIIELLIVISLIGLLASILLPALSQARYSARYLQAASTMRQMYISVTTYGNDSKDGLPYFATPGNPWGPVVVNGVDVRNAQGRYFGPQAVLWPSLLRAYISGRPKLPDRDAMIPVGEKYGLPPEQSDMILYTRFNLSYTAFSAPEYWTNDVPPRNRSLFRGTRWGEIQFPSQKGILVDTQWVTIEIQRRYTLTASFVMADGSTSKAAWSDLNMDLVERPGTTITMPVHSTRYGLAGRDR